MRQGTPDFQPTRDHQVLRPATRLAGLLAGCVLFIPVLAAGQSLTDTADQQPYPAPLVGDPAAIQPTTQTTFPDQDGSDPQAGDAALREDLNRLNLREGTIDGLRTRYDNTRNDASGIRIGTFILKPTLGQSYNHEFNKGGSDDDRGISKPASRAR